MAVNYDDERFNRVIEEQNQAIQNVQNTYNQMIDRSNEFYQRQAQAAENYGKQQAELQQQNTDFAIQKIEQDKEQAEKDYIKEQKGAYVDWQKQSNKYGVNAELQAQQGMTGTGYYASLENDMYGQYQNRIIKARESYDKIVLNYNNAINEARLTNSSKLAEIAYNALQASLERELEGFQYGNQLMLQQINAMNNERDRGYTKWKDVLNQINYENEQAEAQRRYEAERAEQQRQFNEQMALNRSKVNNTTLGGNNQEYVLPNNNENEEVYANSNGQLASESNKTINGVTYIPHIDENTGQQNGVSIDGEDYPLYVSDGTLYIYKDGKMIPYAQAIKNNGSIMSKLMDIAKKTWNSNSLKSAGNSATSVTQFERLKNMAKNATKKK